MRSRIVTNCAALSLALIGAAGCKLDSLHADAWEVKDEFELAFCDACTETDEIFDNCLYQFDWMRDPDVRTFRRECEADLDDERKHRKAAKAYSECLIEVYETGLACLEENTCEVGGPCDVRVAAVKCGGDQESGDFKSSASLCAYEREQEALSEH